ncbi:MAG: OmpA family protein, partial [Bacteroidota bacterium]
HPEAGYIEERQTRIWRNLVFDFDKSDLLPQSYPVIDSLVDDMLFNPEINVTISGHTDNSGNAAYNLNLSTQRARSVGVYMMEKGINQSRIKWQGMGDKQPLADNSTELGRATNRRVEFEFYTNP